MAATLGSGLVAGRTWTSSDGTKTFEGDFKSFDADAGKVSVLMGNGRLVTFDVAKLSADDKTWIEETQARENAPKVEDVLAAQKIGSKLAKPGVLQKLDGKRFAKFSFEQAPEYYILYFSASW
ncbi:MAG: hypothetical protein HKN82_17820 [Akkermansiaceae bacterium]|nr:hypothetical protein [Akkermansiaceae bacterium]NNM28771.1 hypothetical protein [Akkermansiaceae bacterium]